MAKKKDSEECLEGSKIRGYLLIALFALVIVLTRVFVADIYVVPTPSMDPTIKVGQHLIGYKRFSSINPGDIITFKDGDGTILVKRVIATGGQKIDFAEGKVLVDGKELKEPYAHGKNLTKGSKMKFPHTVKHDSVFVMGDNRDHSQDSRWIGDIRYEDIQSVVKKIF